MKSNLICFINRSAAAALVAGMIALPVYAHHSASGYDMKKTEMAQATIKEFRWGAPHSSAVFVIKGPKGESEDLVTSSATPAIFIRQGFKPKDFKVGEHVEIAWHPSRNGNAGGILSRIKFSDGRVFNDLEFAAQVKALEAKEAEERAKE